jgi:hypothetical protein
MKLRAARFALAAIAIAAATSFGPGSPDAAEGSTPALKVTVYCYSNPERTVIHNNRSFAVTIKSIKSIYQPRSNEPFYVSYSIPAGATRTFYSGYAADSGHPRTLTRQYIYANTVGSSEGARVVRSNGNVYGDRC